MSSLLTYKSPPQPTYRLAVAVEQCAPSAPLAPASEIFHEAARTSVDESVYTDNAVGRRSGVMREALLGSGWKNPACDQVIPCHEKLPEREERRERYEDRDQKDALLVREWLRLGRARLPPQGREERWCRK